MIKCNKSKVTLKGTGVEICSELATITMNVVDSLVENGMPREMAVDLVGKSTALGLKTREELHTEAQQRLGEFLMNIVVAMVGDSEEEGEQADE